MTNLSWQDIVAPGAGFLNTLSGIFARAELRHPGGLPYLRAAKQLFVGSDYGGEHNSSKYQTIAFFMADMDQCAAWQPVWEDVRNRSRLGRRRIAFKNINDTVRADALMRFLNAANMIPGLVVVFAIHKLAGSMFGSGNKLVPASLTFQPLRALPAPVAEKLMRIVHLLGLLIAGFSSPNQDVLWVTDEDGIAANSTRVRYLVDALGLVLSNLLSHRLGNVRVATVNQDKDDLSLEDLLAIPDIAAGCLADVLSAICPHGAPPPGFELPRSESASLKARRVLDWYSDNTQPLRRMSIVIDQKAHPSRIRATHLRFHGTRDLFHGV